MFKHRVCCTGHMSFHRRLLSIREAVGSHPHVLRKRVVRPVTVYSYYSLLLSSFSSTAHVCTAPTALLCAVAEGLSSFDVPISKFPFITNHFHFRLLWSECVWRQGYSYQLTPRHTHVSALFQTHHTVPIPVHFTKSMSAFLLSTLPVCDQTLQ